MRLDKYISDLLYRYECVTVPEFGAFLTQRKAAKVHETTNAFYPPSKVVSFNAQLTSNDGLLIKYIADVTQTAYENVAKNVAATVSEWKQQLKSNVIISLENVGELSLNADENIRFEPSYHLNYLTSSFGLASFVSPAIVRELIKEEVPLVAAKTSTESEEVPVVTLPKEQSGFRFPWKYAAAAALILSAGIFGFREYQSQQQLAEQNKAQETINTYIQQATFFGNNPIELPSITLNVTKEVQNYHVVAGAFRIEENAHKKIAQLHAKGYEAELLGKNKYGLHQVSYASFADRNDAINTLRKIQRTEAPEAWLLVTE